MSVDEIPETRKDFEEFKSRINSLLTDMETESHRLENETEIALKANIKIASNTQIFLAEVNDFVKEMQEMRYAC